MSDSIDTYYELSRLFDDDILAIALAIRKHSSTKIDKIKEDLETLRNGLNDYEEIMCKIAEYDHKAIEKYKNLAKIDLLEFAESLEHVSEYAFSHGINLDQYQVRYVNRIKSACDGLVSRKNKIHENQLRLFH